MILSCATYLKYPKTNDYNSFCFNIKCKSKYFKWNELSTQIVRLKLSESSSNKYSSLGEQK